MRKTLIVLFAAVLLASGAFVLLREPSKPVKFTTTDGTVVEVLKVTSGPKHRFRYGNRWQDIVSQFLPGTLRAKLKPHILEYTSTSAHSLVVWLRSEASPQLGRPLPPDRSGILVKPKPENCRRGPVRR
jgi:hypothetical protein